MRVDFRLHLCRAYSIRCEGECSMKKGDDILVRAKFVTDEAGIIGAKFVKVDLNGFHILVPLDYVLTFDEFKTRVKKMDGMIKQLEAIGKIKVHKK